MRILSISALILGMLAGAESSRAQTPSAAEPEPATLRFQNREIVTLRSMRGLFSPRDRVQGAEGRLRDTLRSAGPDQIQVVMVEGTYAVAMGSTVIFGVLPGDVEPGLTGQEATPEGAAQAAAKRLEAAVQAWSDQRRPSVIARGLLNSLLALALAVGVIVLLVRIREAMVRWVSVKATRRVEGRPVVKSINFLDPLLRSLRFLVGVARAAAVIGIIYLWLTYTFSQFPLTVPWGRDLAGFVGDAFATVGSGIVQGIPTMLIAALILGVTRLFAHIVKTLFDSIGQGRLNVRGVYPDTADAMRRIAIALVWVFGIAMAFPFIPGSDSEALKGVSVLFGLMITLGSSGVISQAMSGLVVVFSRAIKENEYVSIGDYEGTVTQVGALSAKIRTPRNEEITIPNSVLVSSPTRNYSRLATDEGVVLHATVGIGYDAPWREVHAILIEAARRTAGLRQTPSPFVRQAALTNFCVEYTVNAHLERPETRLPVLSELHANIQDAFNEHEIQIMTPAFESQPAEPVLVPKGKWFKTVTRQSAS
jgi:small-conductance mechanosensitive channel